MSSTITDRTSTAGTGAFPNGSDATVSQKVPCRVATTGNITLSGLQTIDGIALAAQDRVLVKDQTDAAENGIWLASADVWTRPTDAVDDGDLVRGSQVRVTNGTVGTGSYHCSGTNPIVIGTDNQPWAFVVTTFTGDAYYFETKATVEAASIDAGVNFFTISGYTTRGDGGSALYFRVASEPTHDGKIQSADGAWWELAVTEVTPAMFGADGTSNAAVATATTTALQSAVTYWLTTFHCYTLNLAGRRYVIDSGLTAPAQNVFDKRLTNGAIDVATTFPNEYLLDFSAITLMSNLTVDGVTFEGVDSGDVVRAKGGILLDNTFGVRVNACEFDGANEACIRDLNTAAAAEVVVEQCRITARADLSGTGVGIDLAGKDNDVAHNIIYGCADGAVTFGETGNGCHNNHIYKGTGNSSTIAIQADKSTFCSFDTNYIDNLLIRLEATSNFQSISVRGNRFLKGSSSSITTFIELAPQITDADVSNMSIIGNNFRSTSGTPDSCSVDTTDGTIETAAIYKFKMDDNLFLGTTERYSHPRDVITLTATTTGNVDLSSRIPFGAIQSVIASAFVRTGGTGVSHYLTRSGDTVTAVVDASSTGEVVVQGNINASQFH